MLPKKLLIRDADASPVPLRFYGSAKV